METEFHVGDHVHSRGFGKGVVEQIADPKRFQYPVEVHWTGAIPRSLPDYDYFTLDGQFTENYPDPEYDIIRVEEEERNQIKRWFAEEDDESTIERMEEGLNKKVEDAVNPAHYKVDGLPEAIDIINHLMHREQYEGFLWGNILKYSYRFGRKGDKAETAGKIAWYATQLKELEEEKRK